MLCRMSPAVCTNTFGGVQFNVMAELFRPHNSGEHVDGDARDGACLGSRKDS